MLIAPLTSGIFLSWLMAESCSLALPLLGHAAVNGVARALLDLPDLSGPLSPHLISFGILGLSFLALGAFLPRGTLRAAARPSLTMGVP